MAKQRDPQRLKQEWLERLKALVDSVEAWAKELEWATRVIEKKMEDAEVGSYKAPALLLQQETVRLFLESVAREAPGTEGIVDLYLMPSYDDIAGLYYYDGRWSVHYLFQAVAEGAEARDAEGKPLSKETLREVFEAMKAHAG